ncbi:hypothetical protein Q0Z83_022970 [Actinoplanes sichuanensis]|nr:hypothetical protein Q0Z83_022970 [Actinoplanes sichuanensis]
MELRHLRALAAIGDEGTISAAAAVLRISQPALSRTLDQLERRIGTTLVERTTRRLALTDAGRRLHERAHLILNQVDDALAEAAAEPQPLHVGSPGRLSVTTRSACCGRGVTGIRRRRSGCTAATIRRPPYDGES